MEAVQLLSLNAIDIKSRFIGKTDCVSDIEVEIEAGSRREGGRRLEALLTAGLDVDWTGGGGSSTAGGGGSTLLHWAAGFVNVSMVGYYL